ncbi:hypothetical protein CANINC_004712 [Pichia inconspicua]|uniref:Transcription factor MBP1 n=1 Tax=Pichia inconspicua TaxID=52247 RepID=A0A4T0WW19_9ASCO|nr:hypothetical protein CANINC_004712 [[Candida] inconspicua]
MHEKLYSATYSGVAVYEFIHPKSSVMRRKKDGWVNATHILKVANFPKAKRTRILEKDVQTGVHEKVQGGYGKYQGTWVPLKRAIEIAQEFGVVNELTPVFDYISNGAITPPPAPKHHHATTASGTRKPRITKAAKLAAEAAALASASASTISPSGDSIHELSKQNLLKGIPGRRSYKKRKTSTETSGSPTLSSASSASSSSRKKKPKSSQLSHLPPPNYNNTLTPNSRNYTSNDNEQFKRTLRAPNQSPFSPVQPNNLNLLADDLDEDEDDDDDDDDEDDEEDENENIELESNTDKLGINHESFKPPSSFYNRIQHEPSTVEFMSEHDIDKALGSASDMNDLRRPSPLYFPNGPKNITFNSSNLLKSPNNQVIPQQSLLDKTYVKVLYNYFIETDSNQNVEMPSFITDEYNGFNVNQQIDNQGNTALHWACAMGDIRMCETLIQRGCDVRILNNAGEEPIVRAVSYANCYTRRAFNSLLDLLSSCLLDIDLNSRTLLHHIALATFDKNNLPSARYYTENLLVKIMELTQSNEVFIEFVNKQDIDGNTALHIMSVNNATKCVNILLGYNARIDLQNKLGDKASDYLSEKFTQEQSFLSNGNHYDSILRPFVPSFNASFSPYQPFSRNGNSYLEPFQNHINPTLNGAAGALLNINQSVLLAANHASTTSMKINQVSVEVINKLNDLSNSFDQEIAQKNDDIKELTLIVDQMDNDINKTSFDIKEGLRLFKLDNIEENDQEGMEKSIASQIEKETEGFAEKYELLAKLIDRSQAMNLAKIVQQYETDVLSLKEPEQETNLSDERIEKAINLTMLQLLRKKSVEVFIDIMTKPDLNIEKLDRYRKLISKLSNMPLSEVDSNLNNIEECLRRDASSTANASISNDDKENK